MKDKQTIHPTAYIHPEARLEDNVSVGAFAVIEADVVLGEGSEVGAHAVLHSHVYLGKNNRVHPHAVLGGLPQDLGFDRSLVTYVKAGDNNVFREGCTVNRATQEHGATEIGSSCYLMNNTHVAHDCVIGDGNIFATGATLGGHVKVGDKAFIGGGVMVHQFCRIGRLVMVQGTSGINKDVMPYTLVGGRPVWHYRLNTVGLRRAGITGENYRQLSDAFRLLRERKPIDDLQGGEELSYLKSWLAAESKRGLTGFIETRDKGVIDDD